MCYDLDCLAGQTLQAKLMLKLNLNDIATTFFSNIINNKNCHSIVKAIANIKLKEYLLLENKNSKTHKTVGTTFSLELNEMEAITY